MSDEWDESEDAPNESRPGMITRATGAARIVRAAITDETPADGVEAKPATTSPPRRPRRRRPSWTAFIIGLLTLGPGWSEFDDRVLDDTEATEEELANAAEIGKLHGRLDEQGRQIVALGVKLSANTAADLEASSNGALEFRHLDTNVTALGKNLVLLMDASGVPAEKRSPVTETPAEITERHDTQIRLFREARARAERDALERAIAEDDTVGP